MSTPWLQTFTGKVFEFPVRVDMFDAWDIAHALAHLCRYNGHCNTFYSVAEHSVLMVDHFLGLGRRDLARKALFHDGAEAYTCDLPRPLKRLVPEYAKVAAEVEEVLDRWAGLDVEGGSYPPEVQDVDIRICIDERDQIMGRPPRDWELKGEPVGVKVQGWDPGRAESEFASRVFDLFPPLLRGVRVTPSMDLVSPFERAGVKPTQGPGIDR